MSWSVTTNGDAATVKEAVKKEQHCPETVKEIVSKLVDECKGTQFSVNTYGHHENGKIANVGITINSS